MAGVRSKQPAAAPAGAAPPRGRPCQPVFKGGHHASASGTAAPIRAAPPPWATHGPEVMDVNFRGKRAHPWLGCSRFTLCTCVTAKVVGAGYKTHFLV
ncbi:unnamed protein product [Symbiodinium pilosum]|uniref:Uncharacterized protein n=1 Tax=Symbiodinium pilosum TaxID=2952 RepID=A0A812Y6V2_SYMPI|nr:unnamed protein product [Symbiodinium pilosum]